MAGLVPAIHAFVDVDARHKAGHDKTKELTTGADMVGKRRKR
jgi:hypothetical protein